MTLLIIYFRRKKRAFFSFANGGKITLIIAVFVGYYFFYLRHTGISSDFMRWYFSGLLPVPFADFPNFTNFSAAHGDFYFYPLYLLAALNSALSGVYAAFFQASDNRYFCAIVFWIWFIGGIFYLCFRREKIRDDRSLRTVAAIIVATFALAAIAFVLRIYPLAISPAEWLFNRRFVLYLLPLIAIPLAFAAAWLLIKISVRRRILIAGLSALTLGAVIHNYQFAAHVEQKVAFYADNSIATLLDLHTDADAVVTDGAAVSLLDYALHLTAKKIPYRILKFGDDDNHDDAITFQHIDTREPLADLTAAFADAVHDKKRSLFILLYFGRDRDGQLIADYLRQHYAAVTNLNVEGDHTFLYRVWLRVD